MNSNILIILLIIIEILNEYEFKFDFFAFILGWCTYKLFPSCSSLNDVTGVPTQSLAPVIRFHVLERNKYKLHILCKYIFINRFLEEVTKNISRKGIKRAFTRRNNSRGIFIKSP